MKTDIIVAVSLIGTSVLLNLAVALVMFKARRRAEEQYKKSINIVDMEFLRRQHQWKD